MYRIMTFQPNGTVTPISNKLFETMKQAQQQKEANKGIQCTFVCKVD